MCNKQKYDKKGAVSALNEIKKHRNKKYRKEKRYYYCEKCNSFHLTSQEEYEPIEYIPLEELKFMKEWEKLMKIKKP